MSSGETPSDEEVENLLGLIAKYTLASHIFWGLWGIISVSSLILVPNAYVPIR
jgi:choline/ethanolamine kinase